jgi:beta-lactamase regulating signal transducer with metallopeptidase domain
VNGQSWLHWIAYAQGAGVVLAAAAAPALASVARLLGLDRNVQLRYIARLAALLCLTAAIPVFAVSAQYRASHAPVPHVTPADAVTTSLARVVSMANHAPRYSRPRAEVDVAAVAGVVWALGFAVGLLRICAGVSRVRALKRDATIAGTRRIRRGSVIVLASQRCRAPIATGYAHPAVILPCAMAQAAEATEMEHIVLHELAHLQRFDDIAALVQAACSSALWCNPFAYVLAKQLNVEREIACDEAVVSQTGKRTAYARTLWKIATVRPQQREMPFVSTFAAASNAVVRVAHLLDERPRTCVAGWRFALALVSLAASMLAISAAAPARIVTLPAADAFIPPGAQTTILDSGDVLITGGTIGGRATDAVEVYRARTHRFETIGPLRVARAWHSATLLASGDVLLAGGQSSDGRLVAQTEIYHVRSGRSDFTAQGEGRVHQAALLIDDGDVLMMGGSDVSGPSTCAFIYDVQRRAYRIAGTLTHVGRDTLTFRLPDGKTITHVVRSL